jgi:hypothetical protein
MFPWRIIYQAYSLGYMRPVDVVLYLSILFVIFDNDLCWALDLYLDRDINPPYIEINRLSAS